MRILHICQRDNPNEGGSLRVADGLVREQLSAGLDVYILFLYGAPGELSKLFFPQAMWLELESSRQAVNGIKKLKKEIRRIQPDLIHSHDGILWPRLVYLFNRTPVVTHAHLGAGNFKRMKDRLGWTLIKRTTDCLIGVSQETITSWIDTGLDADKTYLVPNGVDFNCFSIPSLSEKQELRVALELPTDKKIMVWIGRLHKETKGTDRVERIAPLLPDNTVLVVVGHGVEYDSMVKQCASLIDDGRVIFSGASAHPEQYYASADTFLFSSYRETFGLVILEAIASGLPVLAFSVHKGQGASDLLEEFEAVRLSDQLNAEYVANACQQALDKKQKISQLRNNAISKYSWSAVNQQVIDVYTSVLSDKPTNR